MAFMVDITLFSAAALAVASASLTAFGRRRQRYGGWTWWVGAMWVTTIGAALAAVLPWRTGGGLAVVLASLAGLLLMAWPVLTLVGLRRFHPRQALPGHERWDWLALAGATGVAVLGAWAVAASNTGAGSQGNGPWVATAAAMAVHLYAALLLFLGPDSREFRPARGLAAVMVLVALAPALAALLAPATPAPLPVQAAAAALGGVVLAFMALTLVCERTERQLRDSRRRLRVLANQDTLTQVPNRRHFQELADQALRQDEPGTCVLLHFDIDHFKRINDLFGHAAGDRALCLVSQSMLENLRAHDVPGRQGGDEFVLLLRRTTPRDAVGVAARIVAEVQRRAPGHQLPTLSLSFGVVQIAFGEGIAAALRRADQAMYEAKRQGRSRVVTAGGNEEEPVFAESQRLGLLAA